MPDAEEREPANVGAGVEVRYERLQRVVGIVRGRRDRLEQRVEEREEVRREVVGRVAGEALARDRVDDRELDLRLARVEVEEELVDLVDDFLGTRVGTVDLVDDEDDGQLGLERLAEDEAGLRQRPFGGVDEQQNAVDHGQSALDLTTEIGVPGRVDDVDLGRAEADGRVLGEDGDALLALEVHGVHDALGHVLVLPKGAGLPEHGVDERGLAVVDVRDDRDVAEVLAVGERRAGHRSRVAASN